MVRLSTHVEASTSPDTPSPLRQTIRRWHRTRLQPFASANRFALLCRHNRGEVVSVTQLNSKPLTQHGGALFSGYNTAANAVSAAATLLVRAVSTATSATVRTCRDGKITRESRYFQPLVGKSKRDFNEGWS